MTNPGVEQTRTGEDEEAPVPSFSEQIAEQLGGVRGLVESSVPVAVFVVTNIVWALRPALIISVLIGLGIAGWRLSRREPIRHALNGLFGIGLGAFLASRTGQAKDFHLPTILYTLGYAAALIASVVVRRPLVGWVWSVTFAGGSERWRTEPRLLRLFGRLTVLWAAVYVIKVTVLSSLYLANRDNALGIARLVLGYPPYALLLVLTVYSVRRVMRTTPEPAN
ncbi:DUF3159 domain-containing protein [Planosporangium mesophilum]|uniref:DUF3159 domain-containing protein n=1 Tax=Planosporangium mesophilum TaxID=689768 RepID=A0A8J3WYT3_9ACTN|nr:DUF3159 domain-containing protein [Planosporangium mesophilum]NJC81844.1 DUF3159 domain-containing protein [Planosporangium mesophilum]GII20494.1 hypothetical protein Pme01_00910 [Planosporangium mesophilum]